MKFLRYFETSEAYDKYIGGGVVRPNVCFEKENKRVSFHKKIKQNTILTAKFRSNTENDIFGGLTNECGIKSLTIDGIKVDKTFPQPITHTLEYLTSDMVWSTTTGGTEIITYTGATPILTEFLIGGEEDIVLINSGMTSTKYLYIKPKYGTFETNNIVGFLIITGKDEKSQGVSLMPFDSTHGLGWFYLPDKDVFFLDMGFMMAGWSHILLLMPVCFILVGLDSNGEPVIIDTIHEVVDYNGLDINMETSSITQSIIFNDIEEHEMVVELSTPVIPPYMFWNTCITSVTCDTPLDEVGVGAFGVSALQDVSLNGVKHFHSMSFAAPFLTTADFLQGCKILGYAVFGGSSVQTLTIPDSVIYTESGVLESMPMLSTLVFQGKTAPPIYINETAESEENVGNIPFLENPPSTTGTVLIPQDANLSSYELWTLLFKNMGWTISLY